MTTHPGMADAERLEAMADELAAQLSALPEASFTRRAADGAWTAAEVVAHMTEMLPYWTLAAASVAADPGRPIGRELDDPDRVGAVAAANTIPRAEALAHLRQAAHEAAASIRAHDERAWSAQGKHYTRGPLTVADTIRTLVMEHAGIHCRQALEATGVHAD